MKTPEDIALELNGYASEINKVILGEPDELTGLYRSGSLLSEFYVDRRQFDIFSSFINISGGVAVDCNESLSKNLVIERSIHAIQHIQDLLQDSVEKLRGIQA